MQYVVLAIDDDSAAERFAEELLVANTFTLFKERESDAPVRVETQIVGRFKGPTSFCDPSDGHRGKKTDSGFTKGKKYGWWVCGKCKKPTKQWGTNLNAVLGAARNLVEPQQQSNPVVSTSTHEPQSQ